MIANLDLLLSQIAAGLLVVLLVPLTMTLLRMLRGPSYADRFVALDMLTGLAVAMGALTMAATGRREDEPSHDQQEAERPLQYPRAPQIPDKGLVTLNATADEQRADSGQSHEAHCFEIGGIALQNQRGIEHEEERDEVDDAADPH